MRLKCALPVIHSRDKPLLFRTWQPGDELTQKGKFKVLEPSVEKEEVVPNVLLVPLLMFDEKCDRLGYGGGYYDRTIDNIK
jgi:5-formyltetrahydrofolate cyclo-ligase